VICSSSQGDQLAWKNQNKGDDESGQARFCPDNQIAVILDVETARNSFICSCGRNTVGGLKARAEVLCNLKNRNSLTSYFDPTLYSYQKLKINDPDSFS